MNFRLTYLDSDNSHVTLYFETYQAAHNYAKWHKEFGHISLVTIIEVD